MVSGAANATFVYDGDGRRVKGTVNGVTITYIGDTFEWSGSTATMKIYYTAGGVRLAVRTGIAGSIETTLNWLLGDHLGSTNITANSSAIQVGKLSYKPCVTKQLGKTVPARPNQAHKERCKCKRCAGTERNQDGRNG